MALLQLVLLVCVAFVGTVVGNLCDKQTWWAPTHDMIRIADVPGKIYYGGRSRNMDWWDAKEYCQARGMTLASITSDSEHNALKRAHGTRDFTAGYWTAGRFATSRYVWDGTSIEPSRSYFTGQNRHGSVSCPNSFCILYATRPNDDSGVRYEQCLRAWGALCQKVYPLVTVAAPPPTPRNNVIVIIAKPPPESSAVTTTTAQTPVTNVTKSQISDQSSINPPTEPPASDYSPDHEITTSPTTDQPAEPVTGAPVATGQRCPGSVVSVSVICTAMARGAALANAASISITVLSMCFLKVSL